MNIQYPLLSGTQTRFHAKLFIFTCLECLVQTESHSEDEMMTLVVKFSFDNFQVGFRLSNIESPRD